MNKPTKERVEELAVLVKRAYVGSKCRDKNWRDLLAIVDDYAGWTSPGPTDADEREMQDLDTGTALSERMIQLLRHIRSSSGVSVESGEEGK